MYAIFTQDTSAQPDYTKQVTDELDRIESKIILLNDMLNHKRQHELNDKKDPVVTELVDSVQASQSRLQTFIEQNTVEDRLCIANSYSTFARAE